MFICIFYVIVLFHFYIITISSINPYVLFLIAHVVSVLTAFKQNY